VSPWIDRHKILLPSVLLLAALVYANSFWGRFHFDDRPTILANRHLDNWETFVGHLDHMVRPVLYATLLADRALFGDAPAGYHLLNLLLHLGSGLLVYVILSRAVTEETRFVPLVAALLFLLHPIQTEAVTYISGRASGLMAFWYLFALFLYLKAREECKSGRSLWLHAGACVSFLCALGSKETAVTFPFALILWEGTVARDRALEWRSLSFGRHLPYWLILGAATLWAWVHPRYSELAQFSAALRPLPEQLLSALHAAWCSLLLLLWPWRQSFDHDLPAIQSMFQWPAPLDLAGLIGFLLAVVMAIRRRLRLLAFGMAWWALHMLPAHSLVPRVDLLSERNLYLPSIGALLVMVLLVNYAARWAAARGLNTGLVAGAVRFVGLTVALVFGLLTVQRNALYHDPVRLWAETVRQSPGKARPHNNLGYAYALAGDWESAIEEFRRAARLDPEYLLAQENLRKAYLHQVGRPE